MQTVTVGYATANGTAEASLDYTGTSGTLTFGSGATARTIAVAVIDDELKEEKESFALELSEPWNARLLGSVEKLSGSATITDDDAEPEITSGSALTVAEGRTAIPSGQLTATDEDQETSELTWSIPAGTAGGADGARFAITSGGLLSLKAAQDYETPGDADGDRVYEVTVQVSDGANSDTAELEVTLQDVAPAVTVAADAATIEEGEAAVFTVTRAGDLSGALTVAVAVGETGTVLASGGSGTKRVSFGDGAASATLSAATEDDATPEPGGTVTAAVQTRSGYTVGTPGSAEVTVLDNDASTLTLSAQPGEVAEDASATEVTVTAAWAAGRRAAATELTVTVGSSGDAATEGTDYKTVDDLTLTIAAGAGSTTGTFTLEPVNDALDESDESLTVTTAVSGLTVTPASVKILDDDARGIVVQPQTLTITEGESDRYTVVLTSQPTGTVTVSPSVSGNSDVSVSAESLTFTTTSWSALQMVTVTVDEDDDAVVDAAAVIGHQGSGGDYGTETASVTVTVVEADTPTLTIADASGREDAGTVAFVVSLSVASSEQVTVDYTTAEGTGTEAAAAGSDYTRASGTLTFAAESTAAQTIAVTIGDDEVAEAAEEFTVELSAAQHAIIARATATGTITDDDAEPEITSGSALTVAEGATAIPNGQMSATDADHAASELTWSIPAGTAGGADRARFAITSGGLLSLNAAQDYETPGDEDGDRVYEVTVQVSDGANAVTADLEVTLQDVVATVTVAADADTVEEGTAAVFTVTRAGDLSGALTVAVAIDETGTVLASGGSGTKQVSFSDGAASATLSAATEDDATPETLGTVTAAVQTGTGYLVGTPGRAEVTVLDNDQRGIVVQPRTLTITEGGNDTYTVVLSSQPTGTVTVSPSVSGNSDVSVSAQVLTFTSGNWSAPQTVTVTVDEDDDAVVDAAAVIGHQGSGGDYGTETASVTVTVVEADTPTLTIADASGREDAGTVAFVVNLSVASSEQVTVDYTTADGTGTDAAAAGSDYTRASGALTFAAESTAAQTIAVTIGDDEVAEAAEEFTVELSAAQHAIIARATATGTITDDDERGIVVQPETLTITEGDDDRYTVVLISQPTGSVTVRPVRSGDSDVSVSAGVLTFTATSWSTEQTVTVSSAQDDDADDDEATIAHTVGGADYEANAVTAAAVEVTVDDDETAARALTLHVSADPDEFAHVGDAIEYTYTVTNDRTVTLVGTVTIDDDTLTGVACGEVPEGGLQPAGTVTCSGTYTVVQADVDAGEVVNTATATVAEVTSPAASARVRWSAAGQQSPVLAVDPVAITEADAGMAFTVRLNPASAQTVTVHYATADVTATAGSDYTAVSGVLTFGARETGVTVTVTVHDDALVEPDEEFALTLSQPSNASLAGGEPTLQVVGTVRDDDERGVRMEPTELSVDVGESDTYRVVLTSRPTGDVTVTPTAPEHVTVAPPALTFGTGDWNRAQAFTVTLSSEAVAGYHVIVHATAGADYDDQPAESVTVTQRDGDGDGGETPPLQPSTSVALTLQPEQVGEGDGPTTIRVTATLDGAARDTPTEVTVAVTGATAASSDFEAVSSFPVPIAAHAASGSATFTLAPVDDALDEPDETLLVSGSAEAAGLAVYGAFVTIADDDAAPRLTIADARAVEDAGQMMFHVTLERASGRTIQVVCRSDDVSATAPDDYEAELGVLTLEPGQTAATISLKIMDDTLAEPDETLKMMLSEPSNVELADADATGTIIDDDAAVARMWLSRFGRTVATEVVNAVDHRLRSRMDAGSHVRIAGRRVEPGGETVAAEPQAIAAGGAVEALQLQDLVAGSSFQVKPAGGVRGVPGAGAYVDAGAGPGAGWAVWGSGSAARLSGREEDVELSGQVIGGIAGFDYDWGWMLTGLAVAHHDGRGDVSLPATAEQPARRVEVSSALTSVHPYVRLAPADGVAIWGLLGYGLGGMELASRKSGIEMKLAAFGAHAALLAPAAGAGFSLDLKSDGFLVLMNTQAPAGVPAADADASRLRLVLDGSLDVPLGLAGALRPSLEVGVRYDAGDAETGAGLEVGAGVSYVYPAWGLALDANARVLLAHQDEDYREWGVGGALRVDPGTPGQGLSLGVTSSWGAAASATERLWSVRDAGEVARADLAPAAGSVAAEVGYGVALLGAGAVTPRAAVVFDHGGRRTYRVGGSLNHGSAWTIDLEGVRTEEGSRAAPTHHLSVHTTLRW